MKITYNAPVTLTFSIASASVLLLSYVIPGIVYWFSTPVPFDPTLVSSYLKVFTYVLGHADIGHLMGNLSFILLLGPTLEQSFGSKTLILMILITALVTGLFHSLLFSGALLGASGIVFMMILLSSFANAKSGEVPLTFILVVVLYIGREVIDSFQADGVSQFAHIAGGLCGAVFGYFKPAKR
jgi:membrane associated rhomboid family serine protease